MKKFRLRTYQMLSIVKYLIFRCICLLVRPDNRNVWLISERGFEARDNGYAFYKYMKEKHPEIDARFVIDKKSPDVSKIKNKKSLVLRGSKEHYILFMTSGYLLSTHIMGYSPEFRIFNKLDKWGLLKLKGKRIYLNHGIEQNNVDGLKNGKVKLDLYVCASKPQYMFEKKELGYPEGVVCYTGMPRYDYLKNTLKKQIVVMPTWRTWLFYCPNIKIFKESEYYKKWDEFLRNEKVIRLLKMHELDLVFYPHFEVQPFVKAFTGYDSRVRIATFADYDVQKLINDSLLMVSDYSSVTFDFAYLHKPLIYYQFDQDVFMEKHFGKGYFSYEEDGFGPVVKNEKDLASALKMYIDASYEVETKYKKNVGKTFTLPEGGNCERVYEAVLRAKPHFNGGNINDK